MWMCTYLSGRMCWCPWVPAARQRWGLDCPPLPPLLLHQLQSWTPETEPLAGARGSGNIHHTDSELVRLRYRESRVCMLSHKWKVLKGVVE